MKYQCCSKNCNKVFLVAAKLTCFEEGNKTVEFCVCPFCFGKEYTEASVVEESIISVKSVDLVDVDQWLAQGYQVRELYAKSATLVKKGVVVEV